MLASPLAIGVHRGSRPHPYLIVARLQAIQPAASGKAGACTEPFALAEHGFTFVLDTVGRVLVIASDLPDDISPAGVDTVVYFRHGNRSDSDIGNADKEIFGHRQGYNPEGIDRPHLRHMPVTFRQLKDAPGFTAGVFGADVGINRLVTMKHLYPVFPDRAWGAVAPVKAAFPDIVDLSFRVFQVIHRQAFTWVRQAGARWGNGCLADIIFPQFRVVLTQDQADPVVMGKFPTLDHKLHIVITQGFGIQPDMPTQPALVAPEITRHRYCAEA